MLRALAEAGVRPDLVVGTSIGALNGVLVAADPAEAAGRLARMWLGEELRMAFSEKLWGRAARLVRSGTHLHSLEPLRRVLAAALPSAGPGAGPGAGFSDLELPFQCVAASIEGATARWFSSGPVVPAVMASCAVPGLLPPVEIGGEHYFDGGLVDSIPVGRAVALGAHWPDRGCRLHSHRGAALRDRSHPAATTSPRGTGAAARSRTRPGPPPTAAAAPPARSRSARPGARTRPKRPAPPPARPGSSRPGRRRSSGRRRSRPAAAVPARRTRP